MLNLLWRAGHFLPHILTRTPTTPIWSIFSGIKSLFEKNIIATKMKENG
jgi:hypothetical protein